ncbi:MAG: site-specific integrase [Bryobacteraceae bacterium]
MSKRGQNEGSIYKRKDGRWTAVLNLGFQDGRRKRKTYYGETRKQVQEQLSAAMRSQQLGLPIPSERENVGHLLQTWFQNVAVARVRPKTAQSYKWIIDQHLIPMIGHTRLAKLTASDIQSLLNDKRKTGLKPRTVQHIHAILRIALGQAVKWDLVARNVAKLVDSPTVSRSEVNVLGPDAARALLAAVEGHRLSALFSTCVSLGLRQGEALGLRWEDLDLIRGTLDVRFSLQRIDGKLQLVEPKTNRSRRRLVLPAVCVAAFQRHRARQQQERTVAGDGWHSTGLVFTSSLGTALDGPNVTHQFQRLLKVAGLPRMRFHDLRHTCATLLLVQGIHPRLVMELLGHSQIALTMNTYTHVLPLMKKEVAERMNEILTAPDPDDGFPEKRLN